MALGAYGAFKGHFVSREQAQLTTDVALLKKQGDLFWSMVEQHMTTVLHSPHTPDLDVLLEKYQEGYLTQDEAKELEGHLLELIRNPEESQGNRAGAVFLLVTLEVRYKLSSTEGE